MRFSLTIGFLFAVAGCASTPRRNATASSSPPTAAPTPDAVVYTVVVGDTLSALAHRFHVDGGIDALVRLNGLVDRNHVREGVGLLVPIHAPETDDQPRYRTPAMFQGSLRPCALEHGSTPAATTIAGCTQAACSHLAHDVDVCACAVDPPASSGFVVRVAGAERARWVGLPDGDLVGFDVRRGDLDGDGRPEVSVALLTSRTAGLALLHWDLRVVSPAWDIVLRARIDEYGEGTWLAHPPGTGCRLLATEWSALRDPMRGPGNYLVGRLFAYEDNRLRTVEAPILARRLRTDFRTDGLGPASWLSNGRAEVVVEPATSGPNSQIRDAEIGRVAAAVDGVTFDVRRSDESTVEFVTAGGDEAARVERFGDRAAGRVYPRGYVPPELSPHASARIAQFEDTLGHSHRVVWLGPPTP